MKLLAHEYNCAQLYNRNICFPFRFDIELRMSQPKKRKYSEDYIKYGFTSITRGSEELPQCVVCYKTLSNDAMRPNRLERHLTGNHPELINKHKDYFCAKRNALQKGRLDGSGLFNQESANIVMASYELALIIAKEKKPHIIGETLVKPCMVRGVELVLGKDSSNKISRIALSDNTIKN